MDGEATPAQRGWRGQKIEIVKEVARCHALHRPCFERLWKTSPLLATGRSEVDHRCGRGVQPVSRRRFRD